MPVERTVEKLVARPAAMAAAPAPALAEKIVIKEVPVERIVTNTQVKELPVEVEKVVEKVVTANSSVQGTGPAAAVQSQTSTSSLLTAETQVPIRDGKSFAPAALALWWRTCRPA